MDSRRDGNQRPQDIRGLIVDNAVSLSLIAIVIALAYQVFAPMFPAILWGLLLAVICAHPYERLVSRLRGRRLVADIVFAFLLLMVLLLPALFFAWELIGHFPVAADWFETMSAAPVPTPPEWLVNLPVVGASIESAWGVAETDMGSQIPGIASHLLGVATWATSRIGTFGAFLFEFLLGAIVALFILHNRFAVRAFLDRLLTRIGGKFAGSLFVNALETTRNSFAGVIYAATAQTLLAGIGLYVAGLPAIILFAGFTFLLALIQIGPIVVLFVASAILIWEGSYLTAALLAAWFFGAVMTVDNLIRPYFSTHGTDLPGIIAFIGTVGGFLTWGLIGVFLGPVLTAVIYEMLLAWMAADTEDT
ncbi:AI-2E family transporter [Palleronia sp. KMU-117]|uniref:AI-2E family transporter n=1 Tax=Palleronia sp. KMU-117 TaxID=3434108 RepID=UPI003D75529F